MRPIAPRTGAPERTIAENQLEYMPLTVGFYQHKGAQMVLTRWKPTDEERERIAAGEDIFVGLVTGGGPMQPLIVQSGPGAFQMDKRCTHCGSGWRIADFENAALAGICPRCGKQGRVEDVEPIGGDDAG